MTLKEKFREVEFNINDLETIADEFAIGFVEWYENVTQQREYLPMVGMSIKELLEIYKKEKGL
jgi:hypothetical protein